MGRPPLSSVLLLAASACSSFDGGSDVLAAPIQGEAGAQTAQATLAPAAPGEDWSCLTGAVPTAPPPAAGTERVVHSVQFVDLATRQPVAGVEARACGLTDVECASPLAGPTVSDQRGWVDLALFEGFTGYIEITSPNTMPAVIYTSEPLARGAMLDYPILLITFEGLEALGRLLGVRAEPSLGLVSVRVFDCQGLTAPGVQLSLAGPALGWYFVDGLPSISAAETGPEGFGGFANVPPGVAELELRTRQGTAITSTQSLAVRPGWGSVTFVSPQRFRAR